MYGKVEIYEILWNSSYLLSENTVILLIKVTRLENRMRTRVSTLRNAACYKERKIFSLDDSFDPLIPDQKYAFKKMLKPSSLVKVTKSLLI